jgi:hypothetical protein
MIYKYTLYGKVHNSERPVSYSASIPLGLTQAELWERVMSFSKAFDLTKLELS